MKKISYGTSAVKKELTKASSTMAINESNQTRPAEILSIKLSRVLKLKATLYWNGVVEVVKNQR